MVHPIFQQINAVKLPRWEWHCMTQADIQSRAARGWIRKGNADKAADRARDAAHYAHHVLNYLDKRLNLYKDDR